MRVLCRSRTNSFTACSSTVDAQRSRFPAFWMPSLRESSMAFFFFALYPLFRWFSLQMKVAALFSGGKYSTYAAYLAKRRESKGCLGTLSPLRGESYMFSYPHVLATRLQAEASGVPPNFMEAERGH